MPLFITEFSNNGTNERGGLNPIAMTPSLADQTVAITSASVQSDLFNARCAMVRVLADVNCNIKFGTNPIATANTMPLAAGIAEYLGVPANGTLKIAVIVRG